MRIWQKYFLLETLKIFFLIVLCFYALYVILDYAIHFGGTHYHGYFTWKELLLYYSSTFSQNLGVIAPFALLIATIKTLIALNINNELAALMMGGVKLKRLLYPFILLGLFLTAILYLNTEFLLPKSLKSLRRLHDDHQWKKRKREAEKFVRSIALKDGSILIFLDFDGEKKEFSSSFWIKSFDEIYKIKKLIPLSKPPKGYFIDYLKRDQYGRIIKSASFEELEFPDMRFNKKSLLDVFVTPEELPIRSLWRNIVKYGGDLNEKEAAVLTFFYKKLTLPWLGLLAALAPAPFCVKRKRELPTFFIYAFSLFGLAACFLIIDSAAVLSERQIILPQFALLAPFALITGCFFYRFWKTRI